MIDLETCRSHLRVIDGLCGHTLPLFDCGVKQISPNSFSYEFDGYLTTFVSYLDSGRVSQTIEGHTTEYSSVYEWCAKTALSLGITD